MNDDDKVFVLFLNDMRSDHIESMSVAARASTREALVAFVASERVEPYTTECDYRPVPWGKVFRKDGPLEWFNEPYGLDIEECIREQPSIAEHSRAYKERLAAIFEVREGGGNG